MQVSEAPHADAGQSPPAADLDPDHLSPDEAAKLLRDNTGLMWLITRKLRRANPSVDLEELFAEVRLGFVMAAAGFRHSGGAKFTTYAGRSGWRQGQKWIARECAHGMHTPKNGPLLRVPPPLAILPNDTEEQIFAREGDAASRAIPADFWDVVGAALTERERAVVFAVFREGRKQKDVAPDFGVTKVRIGQNLQTALEKLRKRTELKQLVEAA